MNWNLYIFPILVIIFQELITIFFPSWQHRWLQKFVCSSKNKRWIEFAHSYFICINENKTLLFIMCWLCFFPIQLNWEGVFCHRRMSGRLCGVCCWKLFGLRQTGPDTGRANTKINWCCVSNVVNFWEWWWIWAVWWVFPGWWVFVKYRIIF